MPAWGTRTRIGRIGASVGPEVHRKKNSFLRAKWTQNMLGRLFFIALFWNAIFILMNHFGDSADCEFGRKWVCLGLRLCQRETVGLSYESFEDLESELPSFLWVLASTISVASVLGGPMGAVVVPSRVRHAPRDGDGANFFNSFSHK